MSGEKGRQNTAEFGTLGRSNEEEIGPLQPTDPCRPLIDVLDRAMGEKDVGVLTQRIADELHQMACAEAIALPESLKTVVPDGYARRLIHRCPDKGYTVVAMTWGPGQQTQLHDHAGMWCVECVVEGRLDVIQFDLVEEVDDRCRFERRESVRAGVGDSGCLIPPYEYHVLRNALPDRRSVTVHVYSGEMNRCNLYVPTENGWWRRSSTPLEYDS
jgi:predicted metal-dependent enzyme (double-stranded beta helix superfamily)